MLAIFSHYPLSKNCLSSEDFFLSATRKKSQVAFASKIMTWMVFQKGYETSFDNEMAELDAFLPSQSSNHLGSTP